MSKEKTSSTDNPQSAAPEAPVTDSNELKLEPEAGSEPKLRFLIDRKALAGEVGAIEKAAASGNSSLPITSHVRIAASHNEVEFASSDLEAALLVRLPAQVLQPGATTLPAKDFARIVKALSGTTLTIAHTSESKVSITSETKATFSLPTLSPKDFPALAEESPDSGNGGEEAEKANATGVNVLLPAQAMARAIKRVRFCVCTDPARASITGAMLILDGSCMMLVATDGHRLSYTKLTTEGKLTGSEVRIIVRAQTLDQLEAALAGCKGEDTVQFQERNAWGSFTFQNKVLIFRKIEGQFPNFSKFLEMKNPSAAKIKTKIFRQALETVAAIAENGNRNVSFDFTSGKATLRWKDTTHSSSATDNFPVDYQGERIQIAFNATYLTDFAKATEAEEIHLHLKDANNAALLYPHTGAENPEQHTYVVMPVRI